MKHINLTNWKGSITDWTKLNYIYGGLDDSYATKGNLRIDKDNYNYVEFREGYNLFDNDNTESIGKTFNGSNQNVYSYYGFALKVFNLTIGQTYTISTTKNIYIGQTDDVNNSGNSRQIGGGGNYTFTATTNYLLITNQLSGQYEEMFENLMINKGSTALTYEPYFTGKKYVITEKLGIVDLGTLNWISANFNATHHVGLVAVPGIKNVLYLDNTYCSTYEKDSTHSQSQMANKSYYVNNRYINLKNTACNSASELKTALNNVMLIFELDTPVIEVIV